ncbi:beta-N-acetylglucosaminidase domain-containing protein [Streptomyces sp. CAU 1734]|uniref:beta-N-acetylglucosaminidase domain-containing protein n=1 Tax=Streptomyces sp. CAU 1734 TaxID=3140360 RepID=UPI00325FF947
MRIAHRRGTATAVAAAVLGGLLNGAQATVAAPSSPVSPPAPAVPARTVAEAPAEGAVPSVWPRPQSIRAAGSAVPLGDEVTMVTADGADPYAVDEVRRLLSESGVRTVHSALPGRGPVLFIGGSGAQDALRALRAPRRADLPPGGYRIAAGKIGGRASVAVDGVGESGLFNAAQTLLQLVVPAPGGRRAIAGAIVHDWPGTAVRGVTEGFYGEPWTHQERLAQLDFLGRTKQNRYLWAPGDDPFRQARWREPYPAAQRAEFRELAERARRNHVTLAWAVAPAQRMCLADDGDVRALLRKIDAMWALGVRAFQLQFQDVSYSEWHCDRDAAVFGSGPRAAARAHARVADAVARHLADRRPEADPLSVMPTEYYQKGTTEYRRALAAELDGRVQVAWTGVGVVPRTITGRELSGARAAFGHPLVTMDNYPVNDYAQDRLFLGPYTGREPAVAAGSAALLANGMEQAAASRIPLFTSADYAWNPRGYRPRESWQAAMADLAGGDARTREALAVVAGHHSSSILDPAESEYLKPLLAEFWRLRTTGGATAAGAGTAGKGTAGKGTADRETAAAGERAAAALRAAFTAMRQAPERLTRPAEGRLDDELRPWLDQLARYGRAGELAVDLLGAQSRGDGAAAWRLSLALEPVRAELAASRATVGKGVLDVFLKRVAREAAAWTGADRAAAGAGRDTVQLPRARPLESVVVMTGPGSGQGVLEAHVPGAGWQRLGPLSSGGWTQADGGGLRADAIRVTARGRESVDVRSLVPWFADEPAVELELARTELDAEIGGAPQRAALRLTPRRPGEVSGTVTATAPAGIEVTVPKRTAVPRGVRTTVPVVVSVPKGTPAGEYRVTVAFAGREQTLTVRAAPPTAGPDLARVPGAEASSSGDETPDFPALAAVDGDPASRWSSPAEDGAWWQLRLATPARVGRVVLRWQEAYAAKYRVQVSEDGRTWRTAATVRDGRGGAETVRMDSGVVRFIRVQGDARATRFGYSLWSVEAYEVAGGR